MAAEKVNAKIPAHVGIIMDGNRRWARARLLPASAGHSAGMDNMVALADKANELGIKYLTVYALSTENLKRSKEELDALFRLIKKYFTANVKKIIKKGAAVKVIGDLSLLPEDVQDALSEGLSNSPESANFTFILAICYGSRSEIVRAVNDAVKGGKQVDEESFFSYLYTKDIPDPDFIIRTGGELRLSNFLLWQAAYSELYFTDDLFPDFNADKFEAALKNYSARTRRFGKL